MREKLVKYLDKAFVTLMAIDLVLIILGSVFIISDKVFVKNAQKTVGYISQAEKQDNGKKKYTVLYYADDGQHYAEYGYGDEYTYIGETVSMYFSKENPEEIYIKTATVWYVLLYLGIGLAAAEAIAYLPLKKREVLYKENLKVYCRVKETRESWVTGKILVCDSSAVPARKGKPFLSGTVNKKYAKSVKNRSLAVYYHAKNPNIYIVDTKTKY